MKGGVKNRADVRFYLGASGSGKSARVKQYLDKMRPARLLVWSPLEKTDNYGKYGQVVRSVRDAARLMAGNAYGVVVFPAMGNNAEQFNAFCQVAKAWGERAPLTVVVEELHDVTRASYAPPWWSILSRTGRHDGSTIIGISQRPADVDKAFWSNSTYISTGLLGNEPDRKLVAREMSIPVADLEILKPLDYIELDKNTRKVTKGKIKF